MKKLNPVQRMVAADTVCSGSGERSCERIVPAETKLAYLRQNLSDTIREVRRELRISQVEADDMRVTMVLAGGLGALKAVARSLRAPIPASFVGGNAEDQRP